jgi:hypothetical protein
MAIASDYIFREQARIRQEYEIERELKAGKTVAVPNINNFMASIQNGDTPNYSTANYDELRYNHNSMTYETKSQTIKIRELENQLAQKELNKKVEDGEEKMKLENLVAYYYNR